MIIVVDFNDQLAGVFRASFLGSKMCHRNSLVIKKKKKYIKIIEWLMNSYETHWDFMPASKCHTREMVKIITMFITICSICLLGKIVGFSFIKLIQEIQWLSGSFGCQHGTESEKESYNSMNYILNSVALDDNI